MNDSNQGRIVALGTLGAIIGGAAGYFLYLWIVRQGLYALLVPALFLGYGALLLGRGRSLILGIICAFAALALTIYSEWSAFPFKADESLGYFVSNIQELRPITLIMLALSPVIGFVLGFGRARKKAEG